MDNFEPSTETTRVTYWQALPTWGRIAILSFGGPTAQIALMHRILVDEKKWVGESRFLHALNYCMLLPGPEAQQLATYIGWLMHGTRGSLTAGLLFILPGFVSILALSIVYVLYQQVPAVDAVFFGLKAAVLAIVLQAVVRIGSRVLKTRPMLTLAAASFLAIFLFRVPFPLIILIAGIVGFVGHAFIPRWFPDMPHGKNRTSGDGADHADSMIEPGEQVDPRLVAIRPTMRRTLGMLLVWLALWWLPLGLVALVFGPESTFAVQGVFFSKAALVTFGGAYSVLTYIAQQAVERYGWLTAGEMLDGLGLAETTPGPLIMVVQFVAFLGAYHHPGPHLSPLTAGVLGSVVAVWATFAPCFLYIMTGAPWIESLRRNRALSAGLSAVTAAVVGVILNLALWLAVHTLFRTVHEHTTTLGPGWLFRVQLHWQQPEWRTLSFGTLLCMSVALLLVFALKRGLAVTLGGTIALGTIWYAWLGRN